MEQRLRRQRAQTWRARWHDGWRARPVLGSSLLGRALLGRAVFGSVVFGSVVFGGALLLGSGCNDDAPDVACLSDADCKKLDDCCEGCLATHISEVFPTCDAQCVQSACMGTGQAEDVAVCRAGTCTLVTPSN